MAAFLFFISALAIVVASIYRMRRLTKPKAIALTASAAIYAMFCMVAWGKIAGFIPTGDVQVYGASMFPTGVPTMLSIAAIFGAAFNCFTAVWVYQNGGFWRWCLISAAAFCVVCAGAGPVFGVSPLYSLFGGCCAFMSITGWVMGLTYTEICVIGNIWIPAASLLATAGYLICVSLRKRGSCLAALRIFPVVFGIAQIFVVLWFLCRYALSFKDAFQKTVDDLNYMASVFHTTYEAVNIVVWVFVIVILLATNVLLTRRLARTKAAKQETN